MVVRAEEPHDVGAIREVNVVAFEEFGRFKHLRNLLHEKESLRVECPSFHVLVKARKKRVFAEVFFKKREFQFLSKKFGNRSFSTSHRTHDRNIQMLFH